MKSLCDRLALRPKEAAEALGVSERTIRNWQRNEGLPFIKVNNIVMIPRDGLAQWVSERTSTQDCIDAAVNEILGDLGR